MTLSDLVLHDNTSTDFESNKGKVRDIVKEAVALYNDGHITEELLKVIAEAAMAFEITESIEKKMSKKAKRLGL
jgi:hypothetical protein